MRGFPNAIATPKLIRTRKMCVETTLNCMYQVPINNIKTSRLQSKHIRQFIHSIKRSLITSMCMCVGIGENKRKLVTVGVVMVIFLVTKNVLLQLQKGTIFANYLFPLTIVKLLHYFSSVFSASSLFGANERCTQTQKG